VAAEAAEAVNIIFSTPGRWQTMIGDPSLRAFMENILFSVNENESLLRLAARSVSTNPRAGLAREQILGTLTAMVLIGNGINFAATGNPLPKEAYNPINLRDPYAFFGFSYQNRFMSPRMPFITGSAGQHVYIDIMGQMDTALRLANPFSFIGARLNIVPRAIYNQMVQKSFFGQRLDTTSLRIGQLLMDLGLPIGGHGPLGVATEKFPALQKVFPRGERRLGTAGNIIQGIGINLRSESKESIARRFLPGYDDLPDVLPPNAKQNEISKQSVMNRLGRLLNGTVETDPLFPGLKYKDFKPESAGEAVPSGTAPSWTESGSRPEFQKIFGP
jgi:hypothetical protein